MSDSSDGRASPPFVAALLVTVFGTMCVSEQKQKKLSAPLVGRRGGMGTCVPWHARGLADLPAVRGRRTANVQFLSRSRLSASR